MTLRRFSISCGIFALASTVWAGPPTSAFLWLNKNILNRLTISGERELGLHFVQVSGDQNAYNTLTNFGQGNQTFTDTGQMSVIGQKVLGLFNFDLQFADSRYNNPMDSRFSLDYNRNGIAVDAGDIRGSLYTQNRFLAFSRQLWGLSFGMSRGRTDLHLLHSSARSTAQTISFNGNNSQGPYYLQNSQIVPDSVQVQVDGQTLKYPNDFTVDSLVGSITFTKISVAPTSTIVVSYESMGVNTGRGSVDGLSGDYDLGKFGSIGFAAIHQTDPNASSLGTIDNRFQGFGDPSIPYFLDYVPLQSAPIIVKVDGILQAPNIDYYFSSTNPVVFYFRRAILSSSTIDVFYTPQPSSSLGGDRTEYGLNYRLNFGKLGRDGNLLYSQAWSHLANPITPLSGFAKGLTAVYNFKHYKLTASYDDIPASFVGVESSGFLRNEVATQFGAQYAFKTLQYGVNATNSAVALRNVDSNGVVSFTDTRTTQDTGFVTFHTSDQALWSVNQTHETSNSTLGDSRADISSINYTKPIGKLNLSLGLNRTSGFGPISNGLTSTDGNVLSNAITAHADYVAGRGLTFGGRTSLSAITAGGQSGNGTDLSLNGMYQSPKQNLIFQSTYAISNSGTLATLGGFSNGFGAGYDGNGFSSGISTSSGLNSNFNTSGTNLREFSNSASYIVNQRLSTSLTFGTYEQSGSVSTNSLSTSYGVSTDYDLRNNERISFSLTQSNTSFIGSTSNSNATTLNLFSYGHPKGPWSYNAELSLLLSSGGQFAQNSVTWQASLRNHIRDNQALILDMQVGNVSNYQPQSTTEFSVGYEYQVFKNLALIGRYSIRNVINLDPALTGGAYSSHGFNLLFDFRY